MSATWWILRYRGRALRRRLVADAFVLLAIAPLLLGGLGWVLARYADVLRETLRAGLAEHAEGAGLALALAATAALLPAARREAFAVANPLDPLPVAALARFHVALLGVLARAAVGGAGFVALLALLRGGLPSPGEALHWALSVAAGMAVAAFWALLAALLLVRTRWLAPAGLLPMALLATVALTVPSAEFLIAPWSGAGQSLAAALASAAGVAPYVAGSSSVHGWALSLVVAYAAGALSWRRYRRRDLGRAAALAKPRFARATAARWLGRSRPLQAEVGRDLLLLVRRFSPVVALALGGAALTLAATGALMLSGLGTVAARRLAVGGSAVAVLCAVALVPAVLRHQLPRFWVEKTAGVELREVWLAKAWLALVVGAPWAFGAIGVALVCGGFDGGAAWRIALQILLADAMVASMVGLAVFELASRPFLGLVAGAFPGLALGALVVFYPQAWWLWMAAWGWLAGELAKRASRRVRLTEAPV